MGLDVYFRRDIANILRSTACSSSGAMTLALELMGDKSNGLTKEQREQLMLIYQQGVLTTLLSVGLAFGLAPQTETDIHRNSKGEPNLADLLWDEIPSA